MKAKVIFGAAIAAVLLLAAACNKETKPVQLQSPVPACLIAQNSTDCTVSWSAVDNAVSYNWKLYEANDKSMPVESESGVTYLSVDFAGLKENAKYEFEIVAVAAANSDYLDSEIGSTSFTTGVLPKPLSTPVLTCNADDKSANCTISWNAVDKASSYSWQLFEAADKSVAVKSAEKVSECEVKFDDLKEETDYVFEVIAIAVTGSDDLDSETASVKFHTGAVPRAEAPKFKTSCYTDYGVCVTWSEVAGAEFKYRIVKKEDPSTNLNSDADATFTEPYVVLNGLSAATSYIVYVQVVPPAESGLEASIESAFEFATEAEATEPWVAVSFEYRVFAEKNTIFCHNVPNSKAAHYYTTTENVNVIGEGYASEKELANYVVWDYEDHVPGVYCDTPLHRFNNNGQGWKAGDKLFYAAVGETANGDTKLNWFWVEMPENPGDDVKILDTHK